MIDRFIRIDGSNVVVDDVIRGTVLNAEPQSPALYDTVSYQAPRVDFMGAPIPNESVSALKTWNGIGWAGLVGTGEWMTFNE